MVNVASASFLTIYAIFYVNVDKKMADETLPSLDSDLLCAPGRPPMALHSANFTMFCAFMDQSLTAIDWIWGLIIYLFVYAMGGWSFNHSDLVYIENKYNILWGLDNTIKVNKIYLMKPKKLFLVLTHRTGGRPEVVTRSIGRPQRRFGHRWYMRMSGIIHICTLYNTMRTYCSSLCVNFESFFQLECIIMAAEELQVPHKR